MGMLGSFYELTEARHGRFVYNVNDLVIGRSLQAYGEWSEAEIWLFRQIVRPGDTVVEAGANIGAHTVSLSRLVGEAGTVYTFEPARLTHQLLCANLALNECTNVHALQQAIGAEPGQVDFPRLDPKRRQNFGGAAIGQASQGVEKVALQTIDALQLESLAFIKADVEGFEPQLLRGARRTIERLHPVLYLEIDANIFPHGNRDELVGFLEPLGYACYYFVAPMFSPDNFRRNAEDIFHASSLDLVCVPEAHATLQGLTRARVGDNAIRLKPGEIVYATQPWSACRFEHKGNTP